MELWDKNWLYLSVVGSFVVRGLGLNIRFTVLLAHNDVGLHGVSNCLYLCLRLYDKLVRPCKPFRPAVFWSFQLQDWRGDRSKLNEKQRYRLLAHTLAASNIL